MNAFLSLIFAVYMAFAISLSMCASLSSFLLCLIVSCAAAILLWALLHRQEEPVLKTEKWFAGGKRLRYSGVIYFSIVFLFSVFYWLGYYPGGFNLDAYGQWMQAHGTMPYNNWHPFVSTLLIQFCVAIYDSFEFCILVQIVLFSVSVSYLLKAIEKCGVSPTVLIGISVVIGLFPSIGLNTLCLTKDVQFTILIVFLTGCSVSVVSSDGQWLKNWCHTLWLVTLSVLALLVRHNGVLFVAPMLFIMILSFPHARRWILGASAVVVVLAGLVKGPVSNTLQVEPHDNVVGEAVGIPMAIMANALVSDPAHIPDEVHEFLNEIATDEQWQDEYIPGEWDSCKWVFGDGSLFKNESPGRILSLTFKTVKACPSAAYESARLNTQIVWDFIHTEPSWVPEEYIAENDVGIVSSPVKLLHSIGEGMKTISVFPGLSALIWNTGFQIAAILIIYLLRMPKISPKKTVLFLPLLAYDFGTMLLLAGPNQRYFYCNAVLYIPIIIGLLVPSPDEVKDT